MKVSLFLVALSLSMALAQAQSSFVVNLNGANERPNPVTTPATGSGTLTLNPNNTLSYSVTYSGLTGDWSANHIHGPATTEQAAGILFFLNTPTGPAGLRSGTLQGTTVALTPAQITQLQSQLWYVNIHSATFGGGEIRGQIVPVPEPSTYALLGLGFAGLMWRAARRRIR